MMFEQAPLPPQHPAHKFARVTLVSATLLLSSCGGNGHLQMQPTKTGTGICATLLDQTFNGARITKATLNAATATMPETCVVRGEIAKELAFEVRMPANWNHRVVFNGGGGFDGNVSEPGYSPRAEGSGYVTISTNHGHDAKKTPGGSFALDPQMLKDYAYAAVPKVLASAKAVLRVHYGPAVDRSKYVYEGCSGGGRQALIQAQRHPSLFDGIISRAPANAFTAQFLWYQKILKQFAKPGANLSAPKLQTIANTINARCDQLDGLKDNIISKPQECKVNLEVLKCTGAESDQCLTEPQLESARMLYEPTSIAGGRYKWAAFPQAGGETGNPASWQALGGPEFQELGGDFIKYFVAQDAKADPLLVDPNRYVTRLDLLSKLIDAVNPNLDAFRARGGKLILFHGNTDWLISVNNTTDYYKRVVAFAGGQAAADKFVEYFVLPGHDHCAATANGGRGPDSVDLLDPMFDWIEKGVKPSNAGIVATRTVKPGIGMQRPLCKFPQFAQYKGAGDPNKASSFACTAQQ
jgi:feruloyl esterase